MTTPTPKERQHEEFLLTLLRLRLGGEGAQEVAAAAAVVAGRKNWPRPAERARLKPEEIEAHQQQEEDGRRRRRRRQRRRRRRLTLLGSPSCSGVRWRSRSLSSSLSQSALFRLLFLSSSCPRRLREASRAPRRSPAPKPPRAPTCGFLVTESAPQEKTKKPKKCGQLTAGSLPLPQLTPRALCFRARACARLPTRSGRRSWPVGAPSALARSGDNEVPDT